MDDSAQNMGTRGFTIVELLVVVVVIAILAAITIVSYNGITNRAKNVAASSAVQQAAKKVALYAISNGEAFPASLSDAGVARSDGLDYQYRTYNSGKNYCITATTSGVSYYIDNDTHASPTAGACAGHGANGVAVITNLATNPDASNGNWDKAINSGAGTGTFMPTGGPAGIVPTFFRMTITTPPTNASPYIMYGGYTATRMQPVAGQPLSVSAWVRSSRAVAAQLSTPASSVGGTEWNVVPSTGQAVMLTPNVWTRLTTSVASWPATPTVAATRVIMTTGSASMTSWSVGDTLDATGLMATATSTYPEYADGNSDGWVWNDEIYKSTSTGPAL